jgi:flagellar protein FlgJ
MRITDGGMTVGARHAVPLRNAQSATGDQEQERLRGACQQFEAVFLAQLLHKMRETVPEDPLLGDSRAKDIYYGMLDWELAQQMARIQSVGIAETLFRQLSRTGVVGLGPEPNGPPESANPQNTPKNAPR